MPPKIIRGKTDSPEYFEGLASAHEHFITTAKEFGIPQIVLHRMTLSMIALRRCAALLRAERHTVRHLKKGKK